MQQQKLGKGHPDTVMTLANLAVNYRDAGRLKDAVERADEFLILYHRLPALSRPAVAWFVPQAAGIFEAAGLHARAEEVCRHLADEVRKEVGPADPRTAVALAVLGLNLLKQQKWGDAEPVLRECLGIREKQEADKWSTFNTRSMLGEVLVEQKKYAEAEPLLLRGYEGLVQRQDQIPPPVKQVRLTEALERLVRLYDGWGRKESADQWRTKLEAAKKPPEQPEGK
jgi:hypothetical protein